MKRIYHVLNLGAGVQSTALALMETQDQLRWSELDRGTDAPRHKTTQETEGPIKFHAGVFADTGDEPEAVYHHLAWLMEHIDFPVIIRAANARRNKLLTEVTSFVGMPQDTKAIRRVLLELAHDKTGSIGDDVARGQNARGVRFAAIPAYTTTVPGTLQGKTKRQCTKEYKTEVIERAIRREILGLEPRQRIKEGDDAEIELHQYLGLSYDEPKRIFGRGERPGVKDRIETRSNGQRSRNKLAHFPLYDMYLTREVLVAWLKKQGIPHEVPRSACVFCPFKSNREWRHLRDTDPAGWARAIEVDAALRTTGAAANRDMDQMMYVSKQCVPLALADIDRDDTKLVTGEFSFATQEETDEEGCPDGVCGV